MTRLPRFTGAEVIAARQRAGFTVVRVRGSHQYLKHTDGRSTVVPTHSGETIGPGLTAKILRDCRLTAEDLTSLC
jgi:predicted RNA binding protein YcfA (HicA-like mRNA interferase family)